MKIFLSLFLLFITQLSFSQLQFEKTEHDFGDLSNQDIRFVDIQVKNIGSKKEYFLSFRKGKELVALSKGEFILPDSTTFIRIQINPTQKGKFNSECEIYTSDKQVPTIIKVKANLTEKPLITSTNYQACPDFSARPVSRQIKNDFTLKTIDANTKQVVNADVFIVRNGTDVQQIKTKNGLWKEQIPLGFLYFVVKAESYKTLDTNAYINVNRNELILELHKDPSYCMPAPKDLQDTKIVAKKDSVVEIKVETKNEYEMRKEFSSVLSSEKPTQTDSIKIQDFDALPLDNFDAEYFKPINVVFLLDVSTSMLSQEKFDLLKFSLVQILDILRSQDKISLVSYATDTKIILPASSGSEKEKVLAEIKKLRASGKTSGAKGIKLAFKVAEKNLLPEGTNCVIVLTDGAFTDSNGDYLSVIEKYQKQNILFSVVGIKNLPKDELNMKIAANKGNGAYIPVFKLADAQQNVIREIKRITFKK